MIPGFAFVTVCLGSHLVMAPLFVRSVRKYYKHIPMYLLTRESDIQTIKSLLNLAGLEQEVICVAIADIPGLYMEDATQACARKLSFWGALPPKVLRVALIDIDAVLLGDLLGEIGVDRLKSSKMCLVRDSYIGFKEIMGKEFSVLERSWEPIYDALNRRKYCNTGLVISSRHHQIFFDEVIDMWREFTKRVGTNPSIWDQNVFNYCLDLGQFHSTWNEVEILDEHYNTLKEYRIELNLDRGFLLLDNSPVLLLHFNGGDTITKYARRAKVIQVMPVTNEESSPLGN